MTERPNKSRCKPSGTLSGFSLVELLIVVTVLGILVGIVITRFEPAVPDQLQSAAQVVASDIAFFRSLAVANASRYQIQFDLTNDRYWIQHSGSNSALNQLPYSPFRTSENGETRQVTDFAKLGTLKGLIDLVDVRKVGGSTNDKITSFEFDALGALTHPENAVIWLSAGNGANRCFISVTVNSVTGIAEIADVQNAGPTP